MLVGRFNEIVDKQILKMIYKLIQRLQYVPHCLMFGVVSISFYVVSRNWKAYNGENLKASDDCHLIDKVKKGSKWDELPREVLEMIVKRLILPDYVRFGAVCRGWRLVEKERRHPPVPQLPWLMLNNVNRSLHTLEFYSLSEDRVYSIELPSLGVCTAAYEGWLMIHKMYRVPGFENQSFLLNPFSGDQISLPKVEIDTVRTEGSFIINSVLSSAPSADDCFVAGICNSGKLAFCRLGDAQWSILEEVQEGTEFLAIVFYEGALCSLDRNGGFWVCDLGHHPMATKFNILPPVDRDPEYFLKGVSVSLVVSRGDLLLVSRIGKFALHNPTTADWFYVPPQTKRFEIFKLDLDMSQWVEVETLGDHMLFMSQGHVISLSATDILGSRGDCIYFTEDNFLSLKDIFKTQYGSRNLSVFDVVDWSIEPYFSSDSYSFQTQPIWLLPNA